MKLVKTLRAKVHAPSRHKHEALLALHSEWQRAIGLPRDYGYLREHSSLPSFYCRDLRWCVGKGNHSPVILGQGALNLRPGGRFAPWFASIPTPLGRIRVPLRLAPEHSRLLAGPDLRLGMCRLVKNGPDFFLHIVVEREVPDIPIPVNAPVLAVDIGEKTIATSVTLGPGGRIAAPPAFMGGRVRGIRRHHAWLRRRLGRRKALRAIKRIGPAEHRKVDAELHIISRKLVDQAKALGAVLAIGDLFGIRERTRGQGPSQETHHQRYAVQPAHPPHRVQGRLGGRSRRPRRRVLELAGVPRVRAGRAPTDPRPVRLFCLRRMARGPERRDEHRDQGDGLHVNRRGAPFCAP